MGCHREGRGTDTAGGSGNGCWMAPGLVVLKSSVASPCSLIPEGPDSVSAGAYWDVLGCVVLYWKCIGVFCSVLGCVGVF